MGWFAHVVEAITSPRPHPTVAPMHQMRSPAGRLQSDKGRKALFVSMLDSGQYEHRQGQPTRSLRGAVRSPQAFEDAPLAFHMTFDAAVGVEVHRPYLPGQAPAAGWDGEPGAMAAVRPGS